MERQSVLDYAQSFAVYSSGTGYGHIGNAPALPDGISEDAARSIRGAVLCGRRAGLTRQQKDEARAQAEREHFQHSRGLGKHYGIDAGLLETCYDIGYRS